MKTSFDLPEPLLRRAKAAAAEQGRPLRDLVAEAIERCLSQPADVQRRNEPPADEWQTYLSTLVRQADGSYVNPNGVDDAFFEVLDDIRAERLSDQAATFEAAAPAAEPGARPGRAARTR